MSEAEKQTIISQENAEAQIETLFDYYDIDLEDYAGLMIKGTDSKKSLEVSRKKLVKAIKKGRLEIADDDDGFSITQRLKGKYKSITELKYKPISGRAKVEMDKYESDNAKMYGLLAAMSGVEAGHIQGLRGPDLSTAECLGGFFLLS
jgi:hypothetical protein